ncbi:glycosyltransferase family 2 protein [Pelagovum pacificum]|uniref:Glycosyltransferase family 2 protein n=1 Tax=Pelagovum pacificum TaxID=2588711 RepID=A0A5C5GBA8_9RHOB|nr:glycosyltransferase family 2 protein [Pelagovum pacificum]QQA41263.1 glycosyltransferase family 2 protein [Pelagovum pacificum]TNY31928.1 glycosyltransferase family 2 protein [Pelagovum pacificum]
MSPKHTYTIMSMMKDEGHSLVEWVAYHKHIGFDNIVVYTNNCSDGTDRMLMRLEELGWVQHFRNDVPEGKKPQPNALNLGQANPEVTDSEWVLVMDADEFVSIKCGKGHIHDLVERFPEGTDAIAMTWRFHGSSEVTHWNPGMVIENYTNAAPDRFRKGWGVKSMFRPKADIKFGIHRPTNKKGKIDKLGDEADVLRNWINGSGKPMPEEFQNRGWRSTGKTIGYKLVEMNHYAVKSYEAYLLRRVRGNVNNKPDKYNAGYFAIFDRNEQESRNALRHLKGVKKKMAEILSDSVMRGLQDEAQAFHEARVEMLRQSGEYEEWLAQLKEASAVAITELDEVLFTQHLPKAWQEQIKRMQAAGVPDKAIAKMVAKSVGVKKGDADTPDIQQAREEGVDVPEDALPDEIEELIAKARAARQALAEAAGAEGAKDAPADMAAPEPTAPVATDPEATPPAEPLPDLPRTADPAAEAEARKDGSAASAPLPLQKSLPADAGTETES